MRHSLSLIHSAATTMYFSKWQGDIAISTTYYCGRLWHEVAERKCDGPKYPLPIVAFHLLIPVLAVLIPELLAPLA